MTAGPDTARRLAAEGLGTALLLATVVGSGIMAEKLAGGSLGLALLANSLATGAVLVCLILVLGPVSGAHMNPAVSLVAALRGDLPARLLAGYAAAQVLGGVAGVLLAHGMFDLPLWQFSARVRTGPGQWLAEGVATFGLVLTVLGTARSRPEATPFAVGLYIVGAYWFTASTSFANPAVTLARAFTETFAGIAAAGVPAFVLAQLAGALLAHGAGAWLLRDPPRAAMAVPTGT